MLQGRSSYSCCDHDDSLWTDSDTNLWSSKEGIRERAEVGTGLPTKTLGPDGKWGLPEGSLLLRLYVGHHPVHGVGVDIRIQVHLQVHTGFQIDDKYQVSLSFVFLRTRHPRNQLFCSLLLNLSWIVYFRISWMVSNVLWHYTEFMWDYETLRSTCLCTDWEETGGLRPCFIHVSSFCD